MKISFFGAMEALYGAKYDEIALEKPTRLSDALEMISRGRPEFAAVWKNKDLEDCLLVISGGRICRADDILEDESELFICTPMDGG